MPGDWIAFLPSIKHAHRNPSLFVEEICNPYLQCLGQATQCAEGRVGFTRLYIAEIRDAHLGAMRPDRTRSMSCCEEIDDLGPGAGDGSAEVVGLIL